MESQTPENGVYTEVSAEAAEPCGLEGDVGLDSLLNLSSSRSRWW